MKKAYNICIKVNQPLTHADVQLIWSHIDYLCNNFSTDSFVSTFKGRCLIDIDTYIGPECTDDVISQELVEQVYSVIKHKTAVLCFVQLSHYGNYWFQFPENISKDQKDKFTLDFLGDIEDAIAKLKESI